MDWLKSFRDKKEQTGSNRAQDDLMTQMEREARGEDATKPIANASDETSAKRSYTPYEDDDDKKQKSSFQMLRNYFGLGE